MKKHTRIEQFTKLNQNISEGLYEDFFSIEKAEMIRALPANLNTLSHSHKKISVLNENVIETLEHIEDATVLVFCSAKNPGGGILRGSIAQEEEISLHTTWYFHVKDLTDFYLKSKDNALNTDSLLFVEKGYLLYDAHHQMINPKNISLIGAAAPNLNGLRDQNNTMINEEKIYQTLHKRIHNVLLLAQNKNTKNLILGAWGCGVFGLDPYKVAQAFKKEINLKIFDGNIIFSILDMDHFKIFDFENVFNHNLKKSNKII